MSDGKHRTWFNYAPLSTAGTDMKDDGSRVFSSVTIERGGSKKPLELAFIGDEANLELIRVKTPDTDGNLDAEDVRIIGSITEHAITILRLLFNQDIGPLYLAGRTPLFGQFGNDHDGSPQLNVRAEEIRSPPKYDADQIRNAIVATAPIRVLLTLIDEARRPTSPLPFKYLSYYKILELEFRSDRKWNGLQEHLSQYGNKYRKLEIGQASLINVLHFVSRQVRAY
jgi:hypothetical protein